MKTRNLLLWALACGIAIMLAGAVFLFQLATRDEIAEAVPLGTPTVVGDVTATVTASSEADGTLTVDLDLDAPDGVEPTTGFHLIASGRSVEPKSATCAETCALTFDEEGVFDLHTRGMRAIRVAPHDRAQVFAERRGGALPDAEIGDEQMSTGSDRQCVGVRLLLGKRDGDADACLVCD